MKKNGGFVIKGEMTAPVNDMRTIEDQRKRQKAVKQVIHYEIGKYNQLLSRILSLDQKASTG